MATPTPQRTPRRRAATEAPTAPETSGASPPKIFRLDEFKENNQSDAALMKAFVVGSPSVQLAKLCLNSPDPRQPLRKVKLAGAFVKYSIGVVLISVPFLNLLHCLFHQIFQTIIHRYLLGFYSVVGIVTRRHNGVTNWPLPVPILFLTITSYKSSGFTLLKALSVVKKI
jgi:hypothetical protein